MSNKDQISVEEFNVENNIYYEVSSEKNKKPYVIRHLPKGLWQVFMQGNPSEAVQGFFTNAKDAIKATKNHIRNAKPSKAARRDAYQKRRLERNATGVLEESGS